MGTPNTNAAAYCSVAQLFNYHDQRQICDLIKDNDTREVSPTTNTVLAALLKRGAGDIELACFQGNRYTPADLAALITNGGNAAEELIGLNADLTYWHCVKRRHPQSRLEDVPGAAHAFAVLKALRQGEMVFGQLENAQAGLMETVMRVPGDAEDMRRTVTKARRYFGNRSWR
jgi:hypothetical protein